MRKTIGFTVAFACMIALSPSASAFRLIGAAASDGTYCAGALLTCDSGGPFVSWQEEQVFFFVNRDAAADATGSFLTQSDIISATRAALRPWGQVPDTYLGPTYCSQTSARIAPDGINTLVWFDAALDTSPPACVGAMGFPGGTLAIAILTEVVANEQITDADVLMDSADIWEWSTACNNFDVQTVLTHEYGHAIGIHHSEVFTVDPTLRPTMSGGYFCDPGLASGRTLEPDDEAAVACLYSCPNCTYSTKTCDPSVGIWTIEQIWNEPFGSCAYCTADCESLCDAICVGKSVPSCDGNGGPCCGTTAVTYDDSNWNCDCGFDTATCLCQCTSAGGTYLTGKRKFEPYEACIAEEEPAKE